MLEISNLRLDRLAWRGVGWVHLQYEYTLYLIERFAKKSVQVPQGYGFVETELAQRVRMVATVVPSQYVSPMQCAFEDHHLRYRALGFT